MDQSPQINPTRSCGQSHTMRKAVILAAGLGKRMRKTDTQVLLATQQDAAASAGKMLMNRSFLI